MDVIKLIDQDQLTDDEVAAVVETAHRGGKPVVAHAHREDEIRVGLKHGVDCFEHTGLATEPGYPEDILAGIRKRNNTLYWCPTIEGLFLADYTARVFPERLDDPAWQQGVPKDIADDIRQSLRNVTAARLLHPDLPPPAHARRRSSSSSARPGVTMMVGHGQRHSRQLPHRLDLARAGHLGAPGHDADAGHRGGHPLAGAVPQEGQGPGHAGPRTRWPTSSPSAATS